MSSAPSVPGVEVGAPWLGGSEQVLTAGALELLAALHRIFGPRRAELPGFRVDRDAELAGRRCPTSWPGRRTCGRATGGRPRWPRVWSIAGSRSPALADRKMVISALDCGAKIFMAGFEDSNAPISDNLVTGQLNPGNASWRRTDGARRIPQCRGGRANGQRRHRRPDTSRPPSRWWTPPFRPLSRRQARLSARRRRGPGHRAVRPAGRGHDAGAWASRCPSHGSRKCSTHRSKACRPDATSLTRWTNPAGGSGIAPGWPL